MRNIFVRLTLTLAIVSSLAAGILAFTNNLTETAIKAQNEKTQITALANLFTPATSEIFTDNSDKTKSNFSNSCVKEIDVGDPKLITSGVRVYKVYKEPVTDKMPEDILPSYYVSLGKGYGYNASVPIELLVAFTNPSASPPEQGRSKEPIIVHWVVVKSEETPGLGEVIKDQKPEYTFMSLLFGNNPDSAASSDLRTDFQKSFAGKTLTEAQLRQNGGKIDAITAATITSNGVTKAIANALDNLIAVVPELRKK